MLSVSRRECTCYNMEDDLMKNDNGFVTAIVEKMRRELFKKLNNVPERFSDESDAEFKRKIAPIVKIKFSKKEMRKVQERWSEIVREAKMQNVEVLTYTGEPDTLVARYIFFDQMHMVLDI